MDLGPLESHGVGCQHTLIVGGCVSFNRGGCGGWGVRFATRGLNVVVGVELSIFLIRSLARAANSGPTHVQSKVRHAQFGRRRPSDFNTYYVMIERRAC
jgi:hypothetical protein